MKFKFKNHFRYYVSQVFVNGPSQIKKMPFECIQCYVSIRILGMQKQEDCCKLEISLVYVVPASQSVKLCPLPSKKQKENITWKCFLLYSKQDMVKVFWLICLFVCLFLVGVWQGTFVSFLWRGKMFLELIFVIQRDFMISLGITFFQSAYLRSCRKFINFNNYSFYFCLF